MNAVPTSRSIGRVLSVSVALLVFVSLARTASHAVAAVPVLETAAAPLPGFLVLPAADAGRIVRAVATDIDNDGDLDVVANEGTLDLVVWVNDGTGHLTRKRPDQSPRWQIEPPLPSFSDPADATQPPDRDDTPPADSAPIAIVAGRLVDGFVSLRTTAARLPQFAFTRAPRAPPTSPVLI